MKYFKKLIGDNIYLSPVNPEDLLLYTEWINNLKVTLPLGNATTNFSLLKEKEVLEEIARGDHNFAIVKLQDDKLLGNCSLFNVSLIHGTAELGIFIGDEKSRGKGYGKETLYILLEYGFKFLNLNNIMLRVFSFNSNAFELYKKVGFKQFGIRKESFQFNSQYYDDIYMEILKKDFETSIIKNIPI